MTLLHEIQNNEVEVINLAAQDLDDIADEMAAAIRGNHSTSQLILRLCDFNDTTFEKLIKAICERNVNFIFVDVSTNQLLTSKSYSQLTKLVSSKKVEEIALGNIENVTTDKANMEKLTSLASSNSVVLYMDDKTRARIQLASDQNLMHNSIFKPRDFREVSNNLSQLLSNPDILSRLLAKLSKLMVISLNEAIRKSNRYPLEVKEEMKDDGQNNILHHNFKSEEDTKRIIDELPLFIRYKLMDVCIANKLDSLEKPDSTSSTNKLRQ